MAQRGESIRELILELLRQKSGGAGKAPDGAGAPAKSVQSGELGGAEQEWLSGEDISQQFGVSRAAVSKHIAKLREQGFVIEAVTRKGYRLLREVEHLEAEHVQPRLQTNVFGRHEYRYLPEVGSTNVEAMTLALHGAAEGTVVVADAQTMGRGRKGRVWSSPVGKGLYVSLVLRPNISQQQASIMTLLTNVVVAEAIEVVTGITPVCKWPNDVLIDERKVSGNLTEAFLVADAVDHVVTGAGINVLTALEDLPEDVRHKATSLSIEAGRDISRVELLCAYLERYEFWYKRFTEEGVAPVMNRWRELTNLFGKSLKVQVGDNVLEGVVRDVDDEGMLLLVAPDGTKHHLFSGDILD